MVNKDEFRLAVVLYNKPNFQVQVAKIIAWAFFIFLFASCRSDRSKEEVQSVTQLCDKKLYVETYIIFGGGASGGDRVAEYLTDSTTFRKYIGTYVQLYSHYVYKCNQDSIRIYQVSDENRDSIITTSTYFIPTLKKGNTFE